MACLPAGRDVETGRADYKNKFYLYFKNLIKFSLMNEKFSWKTEITFALATAN